MVRLLTIMAAVALIAGTAAAEKGDKAGEAEWLTDFEKAREKAEKADLPILMNFSGSDWCGWCIRLDKQVFSKKQFREYAEDNLVLFLADFPMRKDQAKDLEKQNKRLLGKYGVRGFPTIVLADSKGDVIARTGYQPGGAEKYVSHLRKLLNRKPDKKEN
jgi:protein disulfide-isomerase